MGDHPTGMSLFGAIMAALYQRERTGRGAMVSTSLLANGLWLNAIAVQGILCGARTVVRAAPRGGGRRARQSLPLPRRPLVPHRRSPPDGRRWQDFTAAIGRPDLSPIRASPTPAARRANARALIAILDAVFAERDWAEWRRVLEASRHRLRRGRHARRHPARRADARQRRAGADRRPARRGRAHGEQPGVDRRSGQGAATMAPEIGEHTVEVLREAGVDEAEIARLLQAGVIAQGKPE